MMKIYTNWAFLRPVNTSLHGDFTIENPSFSMSLLSTQEHTIPLCVKILQILFRLELSWFWIEGNGRFWDFLLFMYHCVVKSSVCSAGYFRVQSKGQEISEEFFLVFNTPKKQRNCLQISALASKEWSNQKRKSTF